MSFDLIRFICENPSSRIYFGEIKIPGQNLQKTHAELRLAHVVSPFDSTRACTQTCHDARISCLMSHMCVSHMPLTCDKTLRRVMCDITLKKSLLEHRGQCHELHEIHMNEERGGKDAYDILGLHVSFRKKSHYLYGSFAERDM